MFKIFLVSYKTEDSPDNEHSHYLIVEEDKEKVIKELKISEKILDKSIKVKEIKLDKSKIIDLDDFTFEE